MTVYEIITIITSVVGVYPLYYCYKAYDHEKWQPKKGDVVKLKNTNEEYVIVSVYKGIIKIQLNIYFSPGSRMYTDPIEVKKDEISFCSKRIK